MIKIGQNKGKFLDSYPGQNFAWAEISETGHLCPKRTDMQPICCGGEEREASGSEAQRNTSGSEAQRNIDIAQ